MVDSRSMDDLIAMVSARKVAHRRLAECQNTRVLVEYGFIEPIYDNTQHERFYRLTQRGVDEARRYAEGNKATIEGTDNDQARNYSRNDSIS